MTFEDAQKTLEDLGFNTTWIVGRSNLELGKVYSQAPVAGTHYVPHRTTVVLYRTTEVVTTPPECAKLNLTPEECSNYGTHDYLYIVTAIGSGDNCFFNNNSKTVEGVKTYTTTFS
jgi:beta-lactam-binding protein with PASTA domain